MIKIIIIKVLNFIKIKIVIIFIKKPKKGGIPPKDMKFIIKFIFSLKLILLLEMLNIEKILYFLHIFKIEKIIIE
jgi:hypothetical protein